MDERLMKQRFKAVRAAKLRDKSLLELWVTTFLLDQQPPLIFVWFILNFLSMCSNSMASAHVILKQIRQRLRVAVSQEEKWYST